MQDFNVGDTFIDVQGDYILEYQIISVDKEAKVAEVKIINSWFMETKANA